MTRIIIIPSDSEPYIQELLEPIVQYETLSDGVGGMIEHVGLPNGVDLWVNEEGKLMSLDINRIATKLWLKFFGPTDIIVGNAVLTNGIDDEGETLGFSEEDADSLLAMLEGLSRE